MVPLEGMRGHTRGQGVARVKVRENRVSKGGSLADTVGYSVPQEVQQEDAMGTRLSNRSVLVRKRKAFLFLNTFSHF